MTGEGTRWVSTAERGWGCTDTSLCGTDCKRVQHRRYGRSSERHSLSQSKISSKRTLSDISGRGIGVEREACSVRKDSIVDVSVLHDRSCVVPFTVNYEPDAQQGRCDEQDLKRGDGGGHGIASDTSRLLW
jgi:hypothetical protein